ncbi:DUF433 domain-containing protein [uncultured Brevundimonas sp.]|uniref:DUF433 domain-containing protein n=1 Tax=uncultured Brevundimonas sp. TaxID=213418 RepID=UPI0030ED6613|tara:strand:+ start:765 stop:995 length:231 start_codon:yes stop_codon:yes gene_type:complete
MSQLPSRITIENGKRSGRPCVRDTRITVGDVLGWLASGMSEAEILADYTALTREDIHACLAYAAAEVDHASVTAAA